MKHYLRLSSFLFLFLAACSGPYKHLERVEQPEPSAFVYKPVFTKVLYRCIVDGGFIFKKFHLSGLLFFKYIENGTIRAIYQNELGYTFFDFEWDSSDSFKVNKIIPQLDKPAVIKTLKKDFQLLLMKGLGKEETIYKKNEALYHKWGLERGFAYYIVENGKLVRIENAGEKKKVITIELSKKEKNTMPDSVFFRHHKAHFDIQLNKIDQDVNE
jgi:hypothetical protein